MIEQKQRFRHSPTDGVYGDCYRTAVACLLGVDRDTVPHVSHDGVAGALARMRMDDWLGTKGLCQLWVILPSDMSLDALLALCGKFGAEAEYLLAGMSNNGTDHVVVCKGGRIVWDPATDNSGITGPASNGHYLVIAITENAGDASGVLAPDAAAATRH